MSCIAVIQWDIIFLNCLWFHLVHCYGGIGSLFTVKRPSFIRRLTVMLVAQIVQAYFSLMLLISARGNKVSSG